MAMRGRGRRTSRKVMQERRPGDVAVSYADPGKARKELGWAAERDLDQMCVDAWRWQSQNPEGF